MKHIRLSYICATFAAILLSACSTDETGVAGSAKETPMTFSVWHPEQTRIANDSFEKGDIIGLYVAAENQVLELGGNLVNNEAISFDGTNWAASHALYWDEGTYTAYAYYPRTDSPNSITDMPFTISTDQRTDGYSQSDILYAKTSGIKASAEPVTLKFRHIMSKLTIRLVKGDGFEGELPANAEVYIHNTYTAATVDISAGVATVNGRGKRSTVTARADGDNTYSAILVPQRVANRMPLIEVIMDGVSYLYESTFQFKPGMNHFVNIVISSNPEQVKIEIGGEVQKWQ